MFSEWSDPYDIDQYYGGISNAFKEISTSGMYQPKPSVQPSIAAKPTMPEAPEKPSGILVNNPPEQKKSTFEVKPDSIFLDGHPVGSQPEYNILRSGPPTPKAEKFYIPESSNDCSINTWHILLFIVIVFLASMVVQLRMQLNNSKMTIKMLAMIYEQNLKKST